MKYQKGNVNKQSLLKSHLKKGKYLWINLTKKVKDFYPENYKTLVKETEDDSKKWKDISCSNHNFVWEGSPASTPHVSQIFRLGLV